jgi:hypothetical protein
MTVIFKGKELHKLKAKEDRTSNFMADFDPTTSRREKQKLNKKIYVTKNAKSNLYDSKVIIFFNSV